MPVVTIPSVGEVEFPDTMDAESVQRESARLYSEATTKTATATTGALSPNLTEAQRAIMAQPGGGRMEYQKEEKLQISDDVRTSPMVAASIEAAQQGLVKFTKLAPTAQEVQDAFDVLKAANVAGVAGGRGPTIQQQLEGPSTPPTTEAKVVSGAVQAGLTVPETLSSPLGIATLGTGALGTTGARVVSGAFTADMLRHTPEKIVDVYEALKLELGPEEATRRIGDLALNTAMLAAAGKHAVTDVSPGAQAARMLARNVEATEFPKPGDLLPAPLEVAAVKAEAAGAPATAEAVRAQAKVSETPASQSEVLWSSSTIEEGKAIYLSDRKADAEAYAMGRPVVQHEVLIKKTFNPETSTDKDLVSLFEKKGGIYEAPQNKKFQTALAKKGYDSVQGGEIGFGGPSKWIVVFDPKTLKPISPPAAPPAGSPPIADVTAKPSATRTPEAAAVNPEIIGMGGAIPAEFESGRGTATGIKNAQVDKERQSRGQEPILGPMRQGTQDVWDRVMAKIDTDPAWQDRLIDEAKTKPRALTPDETLALDHRYVDLQNEYAKATRDGAQHYADKYQPGVEEAKQRAVFYEEKLNELEQIAKKVGTESGRSLQMRKQLLKEDFTLAAMESKMRAAKGFEPLTEQEHAEVAALYEKLVAAEKSAVEAERKSSERIAVLEAGKALAEAKAASATGPAYEPRVLQAAEKFAKYMDKKGDEALGRIKARLSRVSAGIDPTILSDIGILGAAKITRGAVDFTKWTDAMVRDLGEWFREHAQEAWDASQKAFNVDLTGFHKGVDKATVEKVRRAASDVSGRAEDIKKSIQEKAAKGEGPPLHSDVQKLVRLLVEQDPKITRDGLIDAVHGILKESLPDITRLEAMDAISGRGKFWTPSQDEISKTVRDLSTQIRLVGHQMDVEAGKPLPRTGYQPEKLSDAARREQQTLNDLKRRYGIVVTDPTAQLGSVLASRKTYYTNRISDLQSEIVARERVVKNHSLPPTDAALESLKSEYAKVKAEHDSIFPPEPISDAQRLERAIAAAERIEKQADEQLARAEKGDFSKAATLGLPESGTLNEIRARTVAMREETKLLRDLDQGVQDQRRIAQQTRQLSGMDAKIEELARQINEGEIAVKKNPAKPVLSELVAKRAELADLNKARQELRNAAKPRKTPEEIALQALKARLLREKSDLLERIAKKDFSPRKKTKELPLDAEASKAKAEVQILRDEFNRGLERQRYLQKSRTEKAWMGTKEALNLSRAILTSWDVSAVFRQGGFIALGNPVRAARSLVPMFKALASEKQAVAIEAEIQSRPNAKLYAQSDLFLAPREGTRLSGMEEAFMSRLAHRIPGVAGSGRAYITFLNKLRADTFDALHESLTSGRQATPEELKVIANYINIATGRGNLGKAAGAAETLSTAFFAPRLVASRFQLLAGEPMYRGSAATRYLVAKEYAKFMTGLAVVYGLGMLAGATVENDPRSSEFGKLKFGNTRVDPMTGLSQTTVLMSRLTAGEIKTAEGRFEPIRGSVKYGHRNSADVIATFLRTKLSPVIGTTVDVLTGKNVVGEEVTTKGVATNLVTPLALRDIYDVMVEQGVPAGTAFAILSLFGMSVQNYQAGKKQKP